MHKQQNPSNLNDVTLNKTNVLFLNIALEATWLIILFFLPLLFWPTLFTTFELAKVTFFHAGVVLLFLMWIGKYLFGGLCLLKSPEDSRFHGNDRKGRLLLLFLGAFMGFYLIATLFSVAPAMSIFGWYPRFQGLYAVFHYVIFGVVLFFEVRSNKQKERLIFVLILSLISTCLIAVLQKFSPGFLGSWNDAEFLGRVYGTMANPNYLATFIVMILPFTVVNIFRGKWRIFSVFSLILGVMTLFFTLSRAGMLAMVLSGFLLILAVVWRRGRKKVFTGLIAGFVILIALGSAGIWYLSTPNGIILVRNIPLLQRFTADEKNISSARSRLALWPATMKQIFTSPIVGYGPETFAITFPNFAPKEVNMNENLGAIADHPHNELLDIAVQIGIPGLIAYLGFLFGLLYLAIHGWNQSKNEDTSAWFLLAGASSLFGLFVANEFGFSVTTHYVLFAAIVAVVLNILQDNGSPQEIVSNVIPTGLQRFARNDKDVPWKWLFFATLALMSTGFIYVNDFRLIAADQSLRKAYDLMSGSSLGTHIENAIDTYGFSPKIQKTIAEISTDFETAQQLAPMQPYYFLNFASIQLQWLHDGKNFSAVEWLKIYTSALHAARLRGYDSYSSSISNDLEKFGD